MTSSINPTKFYFLCRIRLKVFFPTWESILKCQNVIKFACSMTDNLETFLELIFGRLAVALRDDIPHHRNFLESIGKELPDKRRIDMLHNKYFNYFSQYGTSFSPSRFYKFTSKNPLENSDDIIRLIGQSNWHDVPPAECAVTVKDATVLKILQRVQEHQTVLISFFSISDINQYSLSHQSTELMLPSFSLNKHTRTFELVNCQMFFPAFKHVFQELHGCKELQHLGFVENTAIFPTADSHQQQLCWMRDIGNALATMTSLTTVRMEGSFHTSEVGHAVMSGLSHCHLLRLVDLSCTNLTDCLEDFFDGNDKEQFSCLEKLK